MDPYIGLYTYPPLDQRKYSFPSSEEAMDSPKAAAPAASKVVDEVVLPIVFLLALRH